MGTVRQPRRGGLLHGRDELRHHLLGVAFKLLEAAEDRWRSLNGPHLVALVRAGARFDKGVMVERPNDVQEVAA
jgi:hypothetical protein